MKKIIKFALSFFLLLFIAKESFSQKNRYIEKFNPLVDSLSAQYQIPKSIIMGVSIIESGMGKGRAARLLNNYFGFVGKNNLLKTKGIKTMYKQYDSAEESFVDFCIKISKKRYYKKLKGNDDYHLWVEAMAEAGYSTSQKIWKTEILNCIKRYKLYLL